MASIVEAYAKTKNRGKPIKEEAAPIDLATENRKLKVEIMHLRNIIESLQEQQA